MSLFESTATYYQKFRPGIPDSVAEILVNSVSGISPRTLLDLGTGTGQVVEALRNKFDEIIAIDPDEAMVQSAREALHATRSSSQLTVVQGEAETFQPPSDWEATLVTICRAFHWMDQARVLDNLDGIIAEGGAVAIFGDRSFWSAGTEWTQAVRREIQAFLGKERRAGSTTFSHHDRPYREILTESPFSSVEETSVAVQRTWNTESILGYLCSTSFAARPLFGDQIDAFEDRVRTVLSELSPSDQFAEENEFHITVGRRP